MQAAQLSNRSHLISYLLLFAGCVFFSVASFYWWIIFLPLVLLAAELFLPAIIRKPAILFWLLLATLPLSAELEITAHLSLDFPDEPLMILLTGIIILLLFYQPAWFPRQLALHPVGLLLLIHLVWIGITCLYAQYPLIAWKYFLAKTWYLLPFVLLLQNILDSRSSLRLLALCLLLPMLAVVLITLYRHARIGFRFDNMYVILRPFFLNHVNYSSMLVCLLPVGWCCWQLTPGRHRWRKWIAAGIGIGLLALFFTYSRGAWLALLAGLLAAWLIRKKWLLQALLTGVLIIVVSLGWLMTDNRYLQLAPDHDHTIFHTRFIDHMRATFEQKDVSAAERWYRWIAGMRMIADRPLTGVGPNGFYNSYRPYTVRRFETWVSDNKEHSTVHNYLLLIALEQGWPGLLIFLALYGCLLVRAQWLYHQFQSRWYRLASLTVGVVLVMILLINNLSDMIETDKIGSLFWLSTGLIIWLDAQAKAEKRDISLADQVTGINPLCL